MCTVAYSPPLLLRHGFEMASRRVGFGLLVCALETPDSSPVIIGASDDQAAIGFCGLRPRMQGLVGVLSWPVSQAETQGVSLIKFTSEALGFSVDFTA